MTLEFAQYQADAVRTAKSFPTLRENLNHACLGIFTEGGEFATEVKRAVIYDKSITPEVAAHMVEELGDLMWYIALAAEHLGVPMGEMARRNVEKLRARFPERYSNEAAEARADKGGADARSS